MYHVVPGVYFWSRANYVACFTGLCRCNFSVHIMIIFYFYHAGVRGVKNQTATQRRTYVASGE